LESFAAAAFRRASSIARASRSTPTTARQPARAGPGGEHGQLAERLGLETLEKRRAELLARIARSRLSR